MQNLRLLLSEPSAGTLELTLIGEVDIATVEALREATRAAAASPDCQCLLVDLTSLDFMDSSGLHALAEANKAMADSGRTTKLVCDAENLLRVFEVTGLDRVISIFNSRDEAMAIAV